MNKHPLRINLFGGPGSGKSTVTAGIFAFIKECIASADPDIQLIRNIELVTEWCKPLAYAGRSSQGFEQLRWFTEQLKSEENYLQHGNVIVTDSPILLNTYYAKAGNFSYAEELISIAHKFEAIYPSVNFWISRGDRRYNPAGRFQTEEEAKKIDETMKAYIKTVSNQPVYLVPHDWVSSLPSLVNTIWSSKKYEKELWTL